MDFEIERPGLFKLEVDVFSAAGTIGAKGALIIRKTAYNVERDMKALAAVDTGNMRDGISTSFEGDGRFAVFQAEIGPVADYSVFVEEGTSTQAPQPFVRPAGERNAGPMVQAFEQLAGNVL